MSLKKDIIETEIKTKGMSDVQQEIVKSNAALEQYADTVESLTKKKNQLIAAGEKNSKQYKNIQAEIKHTKDLIKQETDNRKKLQSQLKLDEMSYTQLQRKAAALSKELKNWTEVDGKVKLKTTQEELRKVEQQLEKTKQGLFETSKDIQSAPGIWAKAWSNIKNILPTASIAGGLAFLGAKAKEFISEVWSGVKQGQSEHIRVTSTLGDAYGYVAMEADKLHSKMGLTKDEFISAATGTTELLSALGFTRKESAQMGVDVQKLTGALNEYTGGVHGAEKITNALTNGMLGQTKQLRELGVVVNTNSNDFKARQKEIAKDRDLTEEQARSIAVLETVMNQTTKAQDAFAGSGNRLFRMQNQSRSFWKGLINDVSDYFSLTSQQKLDKQVMELAAMNDAFSKQKREIEPLLDTYDYLKDKSTLSTEEQETLRETIEKIAQIAPEAVTGVNDYGEALDINIQKVITLTAAEEKLLAIKQEMMEQEIIAQLQEEVKYCEQIREKVSFWEEGVNNLSEKWDAGTVSLEEYNRSMTVGTLNYDSWRAKEKESNKNIQQKIAYLREAGYGYIFIASQIGYTVEQVIKFDDAFAGAKKRQEEYEENLRKQMKEQADLEKQAAAREAAARQAANTAKAQAKARKDAIHESLDGQAKEISAFKRKLDTAGITEKEITSIKEKEAGSRTAIETEKLHAYEALYKTHKENLKKVDQKEREYRESLLYSETELKKEAGEHAKRLKQAGITEQEITLIKKKGAEQQTDEEKQKLRAWEVLNKQYQLNLVKIENANIQKWQTAQEQAYIKRLNTLKTNHARELTSVTTLEQAKAVLRDEFGVKDTAKIRTLAQARTRIIKEQQKEQEQVTVEYYTRLIEQLTHLMQNGSLEGIDLADQVLSEKQVQELSGNIDAIKLKIAELRAAQAGSPDEGGQGMDYSSVGGKTDILGMSQDDWLMFMENLEQGKFGIGEMIALAQTLAGTFQMYDQFMRASENRRLQEFTRNSDRKKQELKNQLDSGRISQENYYRKVEELEDELELKRLELEIKQAKRSKALSIMQATVNTAVAVTSALGAKPWGVWNIALAAMVGALGAAQVGLIAAEPLPGREKGGYLDVEREQDGRRYHAEYSPQRRGHVNRPTVIVGENGNEYVIPAEGMKNPDIARFVDTIEQARLAGNLRDITISNNPVRTYGKQEGGAVSQADYSTVTQTDNNTAIFNRAAAAIEELNMLMRNGIPSYVVMTGPRGLAAMQKEFDRNVKNSRL